MEISFETTDQVAKLNAYADDHQVYYSHVDPAALEACVSHDVGVANQWYHENGMIVNESKHQCLILGDTEYGFSFPVKDTLEIFGMEIDNKLNFSKHISNVCKKINNQCYVALSKTHTQGNLTQTLQSIYSTSFLLLLLCLALLWSA